MFNLPGWLFTVIALVLTLFVIGLIFARLYRGHRQSRPLSAQVWEAKKW